jgi:hypothetical protein
MILRIDPQFSLMAHSPDYVVVMHFTPELQKDLLNDRLTAENLRKIH